MVSIFSKVLIAEYLITIDEKHICLDVSVNSTTDVFSYINKLITL